MDIQILAFGIAKDIIGARSISLQVDAGVTVGQVKQDLCRRFPDFARLASLRVAVNGEYAGEDLELRERDEVVLIPPVSGG